MILLCLNIFKWGELSGLKNNLKFDEAGESMFATLLVAANSGRMGLEADGDVRNKSQRRCHMSLVQAS